MKKGNAPHQEFINSLRNQMKSERKNSKNTSPCEQISEDDYTEENLQRMLEQKFDELFGSPEDDE